MEEAADSLKTDWARASSKGRLGALVLLVLFSLSIVGAFPVFGATPRVSGPVRLALSMVPPMLPADGSSYPALVVALENSSGLPAVASHAVQVYLASAFSSVGTVPSSVTIQLGSSFAMANVTTSGSPGSTNITAVATGLLSASVTLRTVVPSGFPDHLAAYALPSVQLARVSSRGEVLVQVQDDLGIPASAATPIFVAVSSTDVRIAQVSKSVLEIPAGTDIAMVNYTTGLVTGAASITASSLGFTAGSAAISVVGAPPLVLSVTAEPDVISPGSQGRIVVSLLDSSGDPAEAPADIQVFLTSSNLTIGYVGSNPSPNPVSVIIHKNHVYAETTFMSQPGSLGNTTFTASAHGVGAAFASVKVGSPAYPNELRLFLAPNPVPSNGKSFTSIGIGLASTNPSSKKMYPSTAPANFPVVVTASDNATGKVIEQTTVEFFAGLSYATANFTSTLLPSTAVITASAQNFTSAQAMMTTKMPDLPVGPPPTQVVVSAVTRSLPADGGEFQALLVSLQDSNGGPAIAPGPVTISLSLNRSDVIQLVGSGGTVTVDANHSYAVVPVRTLFSQGTVNVTAGASGYGSSWTLVSTKAIAPAKLALYVSPSPSLLSGAGPEAVLAVQLQAANGNPAKASADVEVTLTSSNALLFPHPYNLTIAAKSDYATVSLAEPFAGSSKISAISPGLVPAETSFTASVLGVTANIGPASGTIFSNQTTAIYYSIQLQGEPLAGVSLTWRVTGGSVTQASSTTKADGSASAVFVPSGPGLGEVTVQANSQATGEVNATTHVVVRGVVTRPPPTLLHKLMGYLPYIGVAAAAAVLVVIFVLRRRRRPAEYEEGLSFGDSPGPLGS